MPFIKKLDHLKLLKIALGVSLFAIGYLLTMFYFQMKDLKEYKHQIELFSSSSIRILHLKSAIESDSYTTQSQILNQNVSTKRTYITDFYKTSFFEKDNLLHENDSIIYSKNNAIKALIEEYINAKNQLFDNKSNTTTANFNSVVKSLTTQINSYSIYLESKIESNNIEYDKRLDNSKTSGFLIALVSLVIFVLAYVKMNEDLYQLQQINDEVIFINETLSNAEMVAGFGSWKINTVEDKFIISNNFYRLLGEEPNSFKASMDIIMSYIHPDDREEVLKLHQDSFQSKEPNSIIYRYLLPDGTIKYMLSVGKFLNNSKGELVKIGVNQDITELMKKTKELEEKNAKLIAINSELESFNNIVGHDFQEPLRKIQMFISRLESKEFIETASETTKGYFVKIKISAQRMQNLMSDLVNYTRTIKGDRIFEQVNLNTIFEEITDELALTIEEKNAKISIDKLPTILGTKFQIQQLFINLISNALKYVKPGIAPIIDVKLENFGEELVNGNSISGKDFHKITISDNGIGFEQKHADKIFMLFKRLETDQTYKGTGLGLAICKKIIENNNGLISAVGIPGQGSVFSVYLPKSAHLTF